MANTVSTNIDLFAQGALEAFVNKLAPLNAVSTDFSPATSTPGSAVSVPLYGSVGVANNFGGDYTANSDSSIGEVQVNLNQHFYKTVHATDTETMNQAVDLYKLGEFAGYSVATSVVTGVYGLCQTGVLGQPIMKLGNINQLAPSGVLSVRTESVSWGEDKNIIFDSQGYSALLGNLPSNTAIQDEALRDGSVGKMYGINLYETNQQLVASDPKIKAIAATPSAIAIATRLLTPAVGPGVETRVVTHEESGATIGVRSWYAPEQGRTYFTAECLAGWTLANPSGVDTIYVG